jgi:hypothetical protein
LLPSFRMAVKWLLAPGLTALGYFRHSLEKG